MTSEDRLERLIAEALRDSAPAAAPGLVPDILQAARKARRRPRWLAMLTERPMRRYPDVLVGCRPRGSPPRSSRSSWWRSGP
jgi:hypothetical protein